MRELVSIAQPAGDAHPMLQSLVQARELLAESRSIDWCKTLRDQAEAVRVYVRQQQLGRDAEVYAAEIKLRAERRIGELTRDLPKEHPGSESDLAPRFGGKYKTLREAGVDHQRASEYERLATLSEETFEAKLSEAVDRGEPVSTRALVRLATPPPAPPCEPHYQETPPVLFPTPCPHCGQESVIQVWCGNDSHTLAWVPAEKLGQDWYPDDDD